MASLTQNFEEIHWILMTSSGTYVTEVQLIVNIKLVIKTVQYYLHMNHTSLKAIDCLSPGNSLFSSLLIISSATSSFFAS